MAGNYWYSVIPIPSEQTYDWLLNKHYAKRIPPISYAYGLYSDKLLNGVCTFGTPLASQLQDAANGICKVLELNRLVINENLEKNALSYFVSQCLELLPKPTLCVSYADDGQGHHGYIYQATNWIYTGLGSGGYGWAVKGLEHMHHTSIEDSVGRYENRTGNHSVEDLLKQKYGDRLYKRKDSKKHRYFYVCANKRDRSTILENFKYEIRPYPKGDNIRYDSSYEPQTQQLLFGEF